MTFGNLKEILLEMQINIVFLTFLVVVITLSIMIKLLWNDPLFKDTVGLELF